MEKLETKLRGPVLLRPTVHEDERGFFLETYRRDELAKLGVADEFVQQNHSRSRRGVVRGMHFQDGMAKLISCPRGSILDVLVDIRRGSPTFGQWEPFELSDENNHVLYCPVGFAHGFCVTSDDADVMYACSSYYDESLDAGFAYDDPDVGIEWPSVELIASDRDASAPRLREIESELPAHYTF
jgi:dTDP-4-dehydrorhamnose 3,5-epimerase